MLVTYANKKKVSCGGIDSVWRRRRSGGLLAATAAGAFRPMSRKPILQFCCLGQTDGQDKPDNSRRAAAAASFLLLASTTTNL